MGRSLRRRRGHISDYELLWIFGDKAPDPPAGGPKDDPLVLSLAVTALVTALVVAARDLLGLADDLDVPNTVDAVARRPVARRAA